MRCASDFALGDWRSVESYTALLLADRRCFAWEWLRRSMRYRSLWRNRAALPATTAQELGLLSWIDPDLATPDARPIWSGLTDPQVLDSRMAAANAKSDDLFDIRAFAPYVSVAVGEDGAEHWLLSDGRWAVRLDLHEGTLLGGPALLEQRLVGIVSSKPKLEAIQQFVALAETGELPASLLPRECRASRWILELRIADALAEQVSQQEMARALFGTMIAPRKWRLEGASYRLRIQRLVRIARDRLDDPLGGPWFR